MLKEIRGCCSQEGAQALTDLENRYPVTVDVSSDDPQRTVVTFTEREEGIIAARFFGDMERLLSYSALFERLEQKHETLTPVANPQQIPVVSPAPETVEAAPVVYGALVTALWSTLKSLFEPATKPLRRSARVV